MTTTLKPKLKLRRAWGDIEGHRVAFFSPPHSEPDMPWVDAVGLARAFLPKRTAADLLRPVQNSGWAKTVRAGSDIVTIICHPQAQWICHGIDAVLSGQDYVPEEPDDGPAFLAYCRTAGEIARLHFPMTIEQAIAAFKNAGGPFLRDMKPEGWA